MKSSEICSLGQWRCPYFSLFVRLSLSKIELVRLTSAIQQVILQLNQVSVFMIVFCRWLLKTRIMEDCARQSTILTSQRSGECMLPFCYLFIKLVLKTSTYLLTLIIICCWYFISSYSYCMLCCCLLVQEIWQLLARTVCAIPTQNSTIRGRNAIVVDVAFSFYLYWLFHETKYAIFIL
jgi:hypothetical protein